MIAYVNGLALNLEVGDYRISGQIEGLSLADIRWSSGRNSGQSGGYSSSPLYGIRNISIPVEIEGDDVAQLEERRTNLLAALTADDGDVELKLVTNAGHAYVIYARLMPFDMPLDPNPLLARCVIELVSDDPLIYDDTTGTEYTVPLLKAQSGGFTFPVIFPFSFTSGTLPATAVNNGAVAILPRITLTGTMTSPVITQRTTGMVFKMPDLVTTQLTDVVEIDMRAHTLLLNDSSIYHLKSGDSSWLPLVKGANSIELTTSSIGDNVTGELSWRSGYLGI